jgi:hypothetical protein
VQGIVNKIPGIDFAMTEDEFKANTVNQRSNVTLSCLKHSTTFEISINNLGKRRWASCPQCSTEERWRTEAKVLVVVKELFPKVIFKTQYPGPITTGGGRTKFDIAGWLEGDALDGYPSFLLEVDGGQRK